MTLNRCFSCGAAVFLKSTGVNESTNNNIHYAVTTISCTLLHDLARMHHNHHCDGVAAPLPAGPSARHKAMLSAVPVWTLPQIFVHAMCDDFPEAALLLLLQLLTLPTGSILC